MPPETGECSTEHLLRRSARRTQSLSCLSRELKEDCPGCTNTHIVAISVTTASCQQITGGQLLWFRRHCVTHNNRDEILGMSREATRHLVQQRTFPISPLIMSGIRQRHAWLGCSVQSSFPRPQDSDGNRVIRSISRSAPAPKYAPHVAMLTGLLGPERAAPYPRNENGQSVRNVCTD